MEDERIKRKMVKTDSDAAQSMELLELNSMSSSSYPDMDVITLEYQSQNQFCGPIGKAIKTCEELPVAPFSSISVENIPANIDRMVLSNDQQYLYDICLAIPRGEYYSDLALRKPGPVAHSRWLTTAAKDYLALINWQQVGRFEPPDLMNVPFKEIEAMVKVRKSEEWSKYPCHNQAVERCIHSVSETSESIYGEEKRHDFKLNRMQSRGLIKHYNTKKDYNL
ncbi:hypothetical protein AVEN_140252-1 [Araneus ventricosus]|uniref:Uncharacterized protein n=1 Tax=Araneus ventricosus TaxID=182803 RepID=A0A4Y2LTZ7_ARAVE|nr:hypothetical protein AVEN_140252-1 [Araneus ventricosus]